MKFGSLCVSTHTKPKSRLAREKARRESGLSLDQLAKRLGKSAHYLARLERDGRVPEHLAHAWSRVLSCRKEIFL